MNRRSRRVVTIAPNGRVEVQERDVPQIGDGMVFVRVRASLLSPGTELSRFHGVDRTAKVEGEATPFGYQCSGDVVELGSGCSKVALGQRVACMGWGTALHSDYVCVPQNLVVPLPEGVSYEEGAFVALGTTALHAVRRACLTLGENVLVCGLGIVGQLAAQLSEVSGCFVLASDPMPLRRSLAERCAIATTEKTGEELVNEARAFTRERGMDCSMLCFGGDATRSMRHIVKTMQLAPDRHRWGRVVIVGQAGINVENFVGLFDNLDVISVARTGPGYKDPAWESGEDYTPVFVRWTTRDNMALFLDLVRRKKVNVSNLITDRFPVERADEACYALIDHPAEHLGVVLAYE